MSAKTVHNTHSRENPADPHHQRNDDSADSTRQTLEPAPYILLDGVYFEFHFRALQIGLIHLHGVGEGIFLGRLLPATTSEPIGHFYYSPKDAIRFFF